MHKCGFVTFASIQFVACLITLLLVFSKYHRMLSYIIRTSIGVYQNVHCLVQTRTLKSHVVLQCCIMADYMRTQLKMNMEDVMRFD
jgi:hypothetical protein